MNFFIERFPNIFRFGSRAYTQDIPPTSFQPINLSGTSEFQEIHHHNAFEMYRTTSEVNSVVKRRGYLLASGTWQHHRLRSDGTTEIVQDSPYVKLMENPNPVMAGNDYMREWSKNELVYGNNFQNMIYALESRILDPVPSVLWNLPPQRIDIETTGTIYKQTKIEDIIRQYRLRLDGPVPYETYLPKNIIHSRMDGDNPLIGDSPLSPLYMEISNMRAAKEVRNVFMKKRGAFGILSGKSTGEGSGIPLREKQRLDLSEQFTRDYGAGYGKSPIMFTESSVEYHQIGYPTKEMMLFEEVSADFRTIIDAYGLNEHLFSREKASTFTNMAEGLRHAYQSTVIPDADEKAMMISKRFGLVEKGEFLHLDYSQIPVLQDNKKEHAESLNLKANAVQKLAASLAYSHEEIKEIIEF